MKAKTTRSRKAISPILATLLLVVIAVAAIVVTYAWVMTYMNNAGQQAGVMLYKGNVRFYETGSTKYIDIDVGNSGTTDTKIIQVRVGTSATDRQNQTITPLNLPAKGVQTVTVSNYPWENGVNYYFYVLSQTGQILEFSEQAPTNP